MKIRFWFPMQKVPVGLAIVLCALYVENEGCRRFVPRLCSLKLDVSYHGAGAGAGRSGAHILKVNCAEMAKDRTRQFAREIFSIKCRF